MDLCDWPQKHVQSFAHFYFNIEVDTMHLWPNREKILIAYQAKVRRQWHDNIARGQCFNIALINQKCLSTVAEEVWDSVRVDAIKNVSQYFTNFMSHSNILPPSSSTLCLPKPCHIAMPCHHTIPHHTTMPHVPPNCYTTPGNTLPHQHPRQLPWHAMPITPAMPIVP